MLMETKLFLNGKILIPFTETKGKRKNVTWKVINLAMSIFVSIVFLFHTINQVLCNVIRKH